MVLEQLVYTFTSHRNDRLSSEDTKMVIKSRISKECVIDCCLTSPQNLFSYVMARTS